MRILIILGLLFAFQGEALAKRAPNFKNAPLMGGGKTSLKQQLNSGRFLLVSFWASWCVPCVEEMQLLKTEMKANADLPLDILFINVDTSDTQGDAKPLFKLMKLPYPTVLDPKHKIFTRYSANKELPFSVLVNEKGVIVQVFKGLHADMFEQLTQKIKVPAKG